MTELESQIADSILNEIKEEKPLDGGRRLILIQQYAEFMKACATRAGYGCVAELNGLIAQVKRELSAIANS